MLDHVVDELAVIEVTKENSIIVCDVICLFGLLLHSIAV